MPSREQRRLSSLEDFFTGLDSSSGFCETCHTHDCWQGTNPWLDIRNCLICKPLRVEFQVTGKESAEYLKAHAAPPCPGCGWHVSITDITFDIERASGRGGGRPVITLAHDIQPSKHFSS